MSNHRFKPAASPAPVLSRQSDTASSARRGSASRAGMPKSQSRSLECLSAKRECWSSRRRSVLPTTLMCARLVCRGDITRVAKCRELCIIPWGLPRHDTLTLTTLENSEHQDGTDRTATSLGRGGEIRSLDRAKTSTCYAINEVMMSPFTSVNLKSRPE